MKRTDRRLAFPEIIPDMIPKVRIMGSSIDLDGETDL